MVRRERYFARQAGMARQADSLWAAVRKCLADAETDWLYRSPGICYIVATNKYQKN